ncbi:MAG: ribonuclease III, partial [bacterium]
AKFEEKINIYFKDKSILKQAFTHRSFLNENRGSGLEHNERLEFLGDAVLELVITDHLYQKYPSKPEGELTAFRSALVNAITLSDSASKIGVNDFLLLSKGEAKDTGRARQYILANTFEAIIGAIYVDQGYDKSKEFIASQLFALVDNMVSKGLWIDAKSRFQELAQEKVGITPVYKTIKEMGPDHNKQFTVGLYLAADLVIEGSGKSKQEAEQEAARRALEKNGWQ